jgi:hypothetical protein
MVVPALPDLNELSPDALRALLLTQDEQLVSTQEQLQSREREIEHLKLLLAKLHRMQFGRKSEKLTRQIEQLELRLEELQAHSGERPAQPDPAPATVGGHFPAKPSRRALPDHLERKTRTYIPKEVVCPDCQGVSCAS